MKINVAIITNQNRIYFLTLDIIMNESNLELKNHIELVDRKIKVLKF